MNQAGLHAVDALPCLPVVSVRQTVQATSERPVHCTRSADSLAALTTGAWQALAEQTCNQSTPWVAACDAKLAMQWVWTDTSCHPRQFSTDDMLTLFSHEKLAFLGDSHTRGFYYTLAQIVAKGKSDAFHAV